VSFEKTLIIIPTYNERDNVLKMIDAVARVSAKLSVLIIDDNSPDGTAEEVVKAQKENTHLHLIKREKKLGLGSAYVEGFQFALNGPYEFIFEMDCDFSHDPHDIPQLLAAANEHDLVIGSRYIDGIRIINWPLKRLLVSSFAAWYCRTITGMPLKDGMGGFKCFRRKTLESLNLSKVYSGGYSFQIEMNYKVYSKGCSIVEVPIIFYERREGKSKMDLKVILEAIMVVFKLRLRKILGLL